MKNYTLNYEDSKKFILNYAVEDNKIIIHYASGVKQTIPYTKENEQLILEIMENQARGAWVGDTFAKIKERVEKFKYNTIVSVVFTLLLLFLICTSTFSTLWINVLLNTCLVFEIVEFTINLSCLIGNKRIQKDIEKNKLYLTNKEQIEESDFNKNENLLLGITDKTKKMIQEQPKDININTMDKVKYKELKQILENIKREREFGFDYSLGEETEELKLEKMKKEQNKE